MPLYAGPNTASKSCPTLSLILPAKDLPSSLMAEPPLSTPRSMKYGEILPLFKVNSPKLTAPCLARNSMNWVFILSQLGLGRYNLKGLTGQSRTMARKLGAAGVSIAVNAGLLISKIAVASITGSIGVYAESVHSLFDLLAS